MTLLFLLACTHTPPDRLEAEELQPAPSPAPEPAPRPVPVSAPPAFEPVVRALTPEEGAAMTGVSWKEGCPVPLADLVRIEMNHIDLDGEIRRGVLVVHRGVAEPVVSAFEAAWDARFPIARMEPVDAFGASDQRSMNANNTSAFNCRPITGGSSWSEHSYGRAIDINPVQNPYVSASGRTVLPAAARDYLDRTDERPGMLTADSALVQAFERAGWRWGGKWSRTKDYQHLSESGR